MKNIFLLTKKGLFLIFLFCSNFIFSQCLTSVSCGQGHAAEEKTDGTISVWGWGSWGQFSNTTDFDEANPIQIDSTNDWTSVIAGKFAELFTGTLCGAGRIFEKKDLSNENNSINLSEFNQGTYFALFQNTSSDKVIVKTIIIK